jgi:hypothetical protein
LFFPLCTRTRTPFQTVDPLFQTINAAIQVSHFAIKTVNLLFQTSQSAVDIVARRSRRRSWRRSRRSYRDKQRLTNEDVVGISDVVNANQFLHGHAETGGNRLQRITRLNNIVHFHPLLWVEVRN